MNNDFFLFLKSLYQMQRVPICCYEKEECVYSLSPFSSKCHQSVLHNFVIELQKEPLKDGVLYSIDEYGFLYGCISAQKEKVLVGPIALSGVSLSALNEALFHVDITAAERKELLDYLVVFPINSIDRFKDLMIHINTVVNHVLINDDEIHPLSSRPVSFTDPITSISNTNTAKGTAIIENIQQAMLMGDYDKLNSIWQNLNPNDFMGSFSYSISLSEFKKNAIGALFLMIIIGCNNQVGLYNSFIDLRDIYFSKIEDASDFREIGYLLQQSCLRITQRIQQNMLCETDDSSFNAILGYINNHLYEKITVSAIEKALSVSSATIFRKFKQYMNMTLSDYINSQKIEKAKALLLNGNQPLKEITYCLAFSNQSYFQNQFKKHTGMTPRQFRQKAGTLIK